MSSPKVALVIPAYNETAVLPELFRRLTAIFDAQPHVAWSAILIDDGSKDGTGDLLVAQCQRDGRFRMLGLSRNFGFQAALMAGLEQCTGVDAVVTMDADLQDPPEIIPQLVGAWQQGAEVVLAVRRSREETGLRRMGFNLFHAWFGRLVDLPIERNTGTFCLLNQAAISAFRQLPEAHRFFPGLRAWVGFTRVEVLYDRKERAAGEPAQNFYRLIRYAFDGIFSFSRLPLRFLTLCGVFIASMGFAIGVFFIVRRLMGIEIAQVGFTTLVTLVLFLGGVQLIGIGVLGEYLGRVYDEVKRRPNYIVKRRVGFE
ncbi:MAG: glycosyltransferase family 2 protein [Cephaloticoccus sp.]|nr:glycosyltransferase family 2 protein [Cephaloticoccus sp.]MCF7759730.1 glycosyltransferase family 2 protein [Cephaloticoccus sp.]